MRRYADVVLNSQGVPQSTATVTVTKAATPAGSGVAATIYSDDGITPIANPVSCDSNGRFAFYVANGRYDLKAQLPSGANYIVADQEISNLVDFNVKVDAVSQGANIGSTTILTPGINSMYFLEAYAAVTRAATTSSTMPSVNITWTDADSSQAMSFAITPTDSTNVITAIQSGILIINAKAGAALSYSTTGYLSSGATSMQYSLHIRLEGTW